LASLQTDSRETLAAIIPHKLKNQLIMEKKLKFDNIFKLMILTVFCLCFTNCRLEKNEKKFADFEKEFNETISKNGAKKFSYEYDGLVPQSSYFINSKLKYIKYVHEPENGKIVSLIYFDEITDSLKRIVRQRISYEIEDLHSNRKSNYRDTIFEILFDKKKMYKYVDNKKVDSTFEKKEFNADKEFLRNMKLETEKKHNSR
jgi:hypothetical protein